MSNMVWMMAIGALVLVLAASVMWSRNKVNIRVEALEMKNNRPRDSLEKVEKKTDETKDPLNLSENHDTFQDMILSYDKWSGFKMLQMLNDPGGIENNIAKFNDLCEFKKNLNSALTFLDKN